MKSGPVEPCLFDAVTTTGLTLPNYFYNYFLAQGWDLGLSPWSPTLGMRLKSSCYLKLLNRRKLQ